jgi:hypothetical protein
MFYCSPTDEHKASDPATPRPSRPQPPVRPRINVDTEVGQGRQKRNSGVAALRSAKMNEAKGTNDIRVHDSSM